MKHLILVSLLLSGCANARVVSWDQDKFTVCCKNEYCGQKGIEKVAQKRCPGATQTGGTETNGSITVTGSTATINKYPCGVYSCPK